MLTCRTDDPHREAGEPPDTNIPVETEPEPERGPGPHPDPRWTPERELEPTSAR